MPRRDQLRGSCFGTLGFSARAAKRRSGMSLVVDAAIVRTRASGSIFLHNLSMDFFQSVEAVGQRQTG
jgi:hypothetical protein